MPWKQKNIFMAKKVTLHFILLMMVYNSRIENVTEIVSFEMTGHNS